MGRPIELADRLTALESERFDVSYLNVRRSSVRRMQETGGVTAEDVERMTRARVQSAVRAEKKRAAERLKLARKLYFNAGRYAAGARDVTAQRAHAVITEAEV